MGFKVTAVVIFLIEVFLSHQEGRQSGAESKWLSEKTGLKESFIRSFAHILLFVILAGTVFVAYGIAGFIFVIIWAALDEITKPLLHNFRHCSGRDILLNYIGIGIGTGVALLIMSISGRWMVVL